MTIRIHPEAHEEIESARVYLESQRPGWGGHLLTEVEQALHSANENPASCTTLDTLPNGYPFRRIRLRRFRYLLIFLELDSQLTLIAFSHTKRRPNYWLSRI